MHADDSAPRPLPPEMATSPQLELPAAESLAAPRPDTPPTLAETITILPPSPVPVGAAEKASPSAPDHPVARGLWNWVLPGMFFLSMLILTLYALPYLLLHWRMIEAQGEAEAHFLKRRAELKAEAEHAEDRLELLDRRVHLASLGFREVARKVAPHVVNITNFREPTKELVLVDRKGLVYDPETDKRYVQSGVGSGIVIKPGVVLTNHHVVQGAQRLRVTFASGQSVSVPLASVAADSITDLAVVRLPEKLPAGLKDEATATAAFADSDRDVQVGDFALAVGSPLGLRQTVTQGVISAKGRLLEMFDLVELLQTDAAINPGNSGGPLFDQLGRVVGINVAIAADKGGSQGIGFAIPSNTVKKIADELLEKGEVPRGYLGIALDELSGPQARALRIDDGAILIKEVMPKDPAGVAGLQSGDVVTKVNNESLNRHQAVRHFRQLVVDLAPGSQATLEVIRNDQRFNLPVTVGKRPPLLSAKGNLPR
jgi:S1-C subfamily serine protease